MPGDGTSVLIVDDNSFVRYALRSFLRSNTTVQNCREAADGLEAVEIAKQQKPDLILMDLSMPRMNGIDAAAAIKAALPEARIVVFTLHSEAVAGMAKTVGVDLVVSKAGGSAALLQGLRNLLADSFFSGAKTN